MSSGSRRCTGTQPRGAGLRYISILHALLLFDKNSTKDCNFLMLFFLPHNNTTGISYLEFNIPRYTVKKYIPPGQYFIPVIVLIGISFLKKQQQVIK
jgi:hypothetical protein